MGSSRRLTNQERRQIVRERAKGVSVSAISPALKVSPKTVYNVLGRGRSAVSANDSRTRVLTMRVAVPRLEEMAVHPEGQALRGIAIHGPGRAGLQTFEHRLFRHCLPRYVLQTEP